MWGNKKRMDRKAGPPEQKNLQTNQAPKPASNDLGGNNRNEYRCHASFGCDRGPFDCAARVQPARERAKSPQ